MDYKPLPVGIDNFEMLITRGYYFVDKTWFIKELLEKKAGVNLFTRPRRFGKTLNMSMLQAFFEDARDGNGEKKDRSYLFEGFRIMEAGEGCLSCMGKYPVISLSLKSAKQPDFELSYRLLCREIADEFKRHSFILRDERLSEEKERYLLLMREKADRGDYVDALRFLSQCLEKYYGRKAIILIDEYDVPLENSFMEGFYKEMVSFIRPLFESALKTNGSLEFAVITGCLRISKESIFTGLNNLDIVSILSDNYDEYFGFTEEDVKKLCRDYRLEHKHELIKDWYNGYVFGSKNVYNPWSVIQFLSDLKENEDVFPAPYWANTSSNSIVRKLIERADEDTKTEIEALIAGGTVEKPIYEDITYDEVYNTMDNMWNFMFFTGYFRKISERMDEKDNLFVTLAIPNREVRYIFRNKVLSWFQEKIKEKDRSGLFTALVNRKPEALEEELGELLLETISFNDIYENFYHGFLAGVLAGMKGYIVKSNREGGTGRSDLYIKPLTRRKAAYVIEMKVAKKYKDLEEKAWEAIRQIDERQYVKELQDDGYETVIEYGISFSGKDCMVRMKE